MKKSSYPAVVSRLSKLLGALLAAAVVIGFGLSTASAATNGGSPPTRAAWRQQMQHLAVPAKGCFTGSYPTIGWQQVQCHAAPKIPFAPREAPRIVSRDGVRPVAALKPAAGPVGEEIGGGDDYSARVASGSISTATGSFPYVSPGSTETGTDGANDFSLQLNTEFFSNSPACAGALTPSDCLAWQQFVYSASYDGVFMQYWLINYDTTCPAGWITYGEDCYENSVGGFLTATAPTIATLESVSLTGTVDSGGNDSVVMEYGGNNVSAVGADSVLDVAGKWTVAEFAILGDGNGSAADFSSGTTLDVKTAVNNGATTAPTCDFDGFTAETNNLSFASAPTLAAGPEPAIETQQTSSGGTAGCASAGEQTAPAAPSNVKSVPYGALDFYITWTSNSTNQTGFQIYNGVTTETVGANQDYYLWAAQQNQYMCIAVRAYNSSGYSAWAGMWTCTTTPPGGAPAAPTNVVATGYSTSAIEISFVNQADNETAFLFYNGVTTATYNSYNEPSKGSSFAVLWTGLKPGTYMCFKVAAYNQWGDSAYVPSSWACTSSKS